jgi:hypothetical protein
MKRTVGASPDSVGVIRWLSAILIGALALALVTTASIHVRESIATSMIQCDGAATADTHSDQSPDDSDKAARHHHGGCHGQFVNPPTSTSLALAPAGKTVAEPHGTNAGRPSDRGDPHLRPPAA